jgi:N-acetylglucosaminyldiphosphoundecaprenol N-acetyl-beta-D-mannosaminyltransferase
MKEDPPPPRLADRMPDRVRLFGLTLQNTTLSQAAAALCERAARGERTCAFFVNAHCINIAAGDSLYRAELQRAELLYADGAGMRISAALHGVRLADNVNGTDLFPLLCLHARDRGLPLALFGARPGVADACAGSMRALFPGLDVVFTGHGYRDSVHDAELVERINRSGARILLVALGVPAQEKWIGMHARRLHAPLLMGVGALFDFHSGLMPRAPLAWRRAGLEWLFRLGQEPRRMFRRYVLGNPAFICRAIRSRLTDSADQ